MFVGECLQTVGCPRKKTHSGTTCVSMPVHGCCERVAAHSPRADESSGQLAHPYFIIALRAGQLHLQIIIPGREVFLNTILPLRQGPGIDFITRCIANRTNGISEKGTTAEFVSTCSGMTDDGVIGKMVATSVKAYEA